METSLQGRIADIGAVVDVVELYLINVQAQRNFSFGSWRNRQHGVLRLEAGGRSAWSEMLGASNRPDLDPADWGGCYAELRGMSAPAAVDYVTGGPEGWGRAHCECAEMALLDLAGRLLDTPAVTLLGLTGRDPVPGLFCVLESDPAAAADKARLSIEQNLTTHIKVKIFGDNPLDTRVVGAVREAMGPEAYVTADANGGYSCETEQDLEPLAANLLRLHENGLSACEDPARMPNEHWVRLQEMVGNLDLIPDYPTRPAREAISTLLPGMGRVYNLHPDCMGTIAGVVPLARRIHSFGAQVMIGDNSLIGPACTAWQQIAIGLGAAWVEALEKPQESDDFLQCVTARTTQQMPDGRFGLRELRPGFGLEVDAEELRRRCAAHRIL